MVYGSHGVGKTTWACSAPDAILLPTEDGRGLLDVPSLPIATTFDGVMDSLRSLATEEHAFKTLVIDSMDHLEPLIWQTLFTEKWTSIEQVGGGYGKGYVEALTVWRKFFDALTWLRDKKGMAIILVAHAEIKTFANPAGEDYDRYQPKLHKSASALVQEWVDAVLFASAKAFAIETDSGKTVGKGSGERALYTEERPHHLAKNRWSLPYELPLKWDSFAAAYASKINPKKA